MLNKINGHYTDNHFSFYGEIYFENDIFWKLLRRYSPKIASKKVIP